MTSRFPLLKITGGPTGRTLQVEKDGVPARGVNHLEVVADVNDVVRATMVEFVALELEIYAEVDTASVAKVAIGPLTFEAHGKLPADALRALADMIEAGGDQ